jgi:Fuc2NAc and GlcNAc transferase
MTGSGAPYAGICKKGGKSMLPEVLLIAGFAFLIAYVVTGLLRRRAMNGGLMDVPNERSSHSVPTPRGGGAAIVGAMTLALIVYAIRGLISPALLIALGGGGLAVAIVGYIDDRYHLSAGVRLAVHFAAALWALIWLGGLPPLGFGTRVVDLGIAGYCVGALGIVWTLNLFNFMDGIDGIAASEGGFIAWSGAALAVILGIGAGVWPVGAAFGAACAGFLVWNWPPARIFMGDVGSGYLGFVVAVQAILAAQVHSAALLAWLILGGVFFTDATVTFLRRLARGEKVHVAHRSHAYQWLARRWASHKRVTASVLAINFVWLLPLAWAALRYPSIAGWLALAALTPLALGVMLAGAGRREIRDVK